MEAMASAVTSSSTTTTTNHHTTTNITDPTVLLHTQLASALSTLGDAQYWEETISPTTIRQELTNADPANPSATPLSLIHI